MFQLNFSPLLLLPFVFPAFVFLALLFLVFLYWRAGKHEYVEPVFLFDALFVSALGAFLVSRVFHFVTRPEIYQWSILRIIFFHIYRGFDFYGAIIGAVVVLAIYLGRRKPRFPFVFDLFAAPLLFGLFVASVGKLVQVLPATLSELFANQYIALSALYFVLFTVFKRLEKKKRFSGYFGSWFLIFFGFANVLVFPLNKTPFIVYSVIPYDLVMSFGFIISGIVCFYMFSGKKVLVDLKNVSGFVFLSILKTKRVFTSIREADNLARSIILAPFWALKFCFRCVKLIWREITRSIIDLMQAFGVKRLR